MDVANARKRAGESPDPLEGPKPPSPLVPFDFRQPQHRGTGPTPGANASRLRAPGGRASSGATRSRGRACSALELRSSPAIAQDGAPDALDAVDPVKLQGRDSEITSLSRYNLVGLVGRF